MRQGTQIVTELKRVPNPPTTAGVNPWVPIYYYTSGAPHDAGGSWSRIDDLGGKNRTLDAKVSIEPYQASCTIVLDNSDSSYDATAATYKGKWLCIDWGLTIGGVNRVPTPEAHVYYYCTGYSFTSDVVNGKAIDTLTLYGEGAWNRLARLMALDASNIPAFYYNQPILDATRDAMSARDILADLCSMAGVNLGTDISSDTYFDTWEPEFTFGDTSQIVNAVGPTGDIAAMVLMQPFRCRAVPRGDSIHLYVPNTDTDWTFKLPTDATYQPFNSGQRTALDSPTTKVAVTTKTYTGTYGSGASAYNFGWPSIWNLDISNAACEWMATSYQSLIAEQEETGTINVPILNPLLELYDYVTVIDGRGNMGLTTGRVGGLFYHYNPQRRIYGMRVRLGGLVDGTGTSAQDQSRIANLITARTQTSQPRDAMLTRLFAPGLKPWSSTLTFLPKVGDEHDSVQWAAGVIKWNDGAKADQTINAGTFDNINAGVRHYIYFTEGSATLSSSETFEDAMGSSTGLLAEVYVSSVTASSTIGIQPYKSGGLNLLGDFIATRSLKAINIETESLTANEIAGTTLTLAKMASGVTDLMFDSSTLSDDVQGWEMPADTTYIDGGNIYTNTIRTNSLLVGPGNYLDDPSFEASETANSWIGWTAIGGATFAHAHGADSHGADALKAYAYIADNVSDNGLLGDFVRCNYGDIFHAGMWALTNNTGIKCNLSVYIDWYKEDKTTWISSTTITAASKADVGWHEYINYGVAPAGAVWTRIVILADGQASPNPAYVWIVDDCSFYKSSQLIVHGTPGGTRTEMLADGFRAYNGATKTFEVSAATGRVTACSLEIPLNYGSSGMLNADIASTGNANLTATNITKGTQYSLTFSVECFDDADGTTPEDIEEIELSVWVTDSDDNSNQGMAWQYNSTMGHGIGASILSTPFQFVAYSGPSTGGTTPHVHGVLWNRSGQTHHYHVTLYKSTLLG